MALFLSSFVSIDVARAVGKQSLSLKINVHTIPSFVVKFCTSLLVDPTLLIAATWK